MAYIEGTRVINIERTSQSTWRVLTSLAGVDHYPHIAQCWKYALMNVGSWWKANLKGSGSLPATRSGYAAAIIFCPFTHLRRQTLISSSFYLVSDLVICKLKKVGCLLWCWMSFLRPVIFETTKLKAQTHGVNFVEGKFKNFPVLGFYVSNLYKPPRFGPGGFRTCNLLTFGQTPKLSCLRAWQEDSCLPKVLIKRSSG